MTGTSKRFSKPRGSRPRLFRYVTDKAPNSLRSLESERRDAWSLIVKGTMSVTTIIMNKKYDVCDEAKIELTNGLYAHHFLELFDPTWNQHPLHLNILPICEHVVQETKKNERLLMTKDCFVVTRHKSDQVRSTNNELPWRWEPRASPFAFQYGKNRTNLLASWTLRASNYVELVETT